MTLVRRPWSEQDIAQIKKLAGKLSLRELADKLDRSDEATRAKASQFGVCLQSEASAVPREKPVAAKAQTQNRHFGGDGRCPRCYRTGTFHL